MSACVGSSYRPIYEKPIESVVVEDPLADLGFEDDSVEFPEENKKVEESIPTKILKKKNGLHIHMGSNIHVGFDGAPGVSGGLSQGEVSGVIRSQHNAIRHCYEKILQKKPNAAGKVTMRFVIGANGSVLTTSVQQDTIRSSELNSCIIARIRTWKFPKPPDGQKATITYPWVFKGT